MKTPKCATCCDTGEANQDGMLDCPDCDAAAERAALNAFVESEERNFATENDIHWAIHQRATAMAEAKFARGQ